MEILIFKTLRLHYFLGYFKCWKLIIKLFVHKIECSYRNFDFILYYGGRQPMEISDKGRWGEKG